VANSGSPSPRSAATTIPWQEGDPIRADLFSPERFEEHAVSLADGHTTVRRPPRVKTLLARLNDDALALTKAYDVLNHDIAEKRALTPAGEWLVDNFHLVERHIRQIRLGLPGNALDDLPRLGSGFLEGYPRVFAIAWAYVAHSDSVFDPMLLARFVRAYESRKALTVAELSALPLMLSLVLIENMRRLSDSLADSSRQLAAADAAADRLLGLGPDAHGPAEASQVLPNGLTGQGRTFVVRLMRRLTGTNLDETLAWLDNDLESRGLEPSALVHEEHQLVARDSVTMRNIFQSLRLINDVSWSEWFESVSLIERELRTNPDYAALDAASRGLYRQAVEELARGSRQNEIDVTRAVLQQSAYSSDEVRQDVGYWLIDEGRPTFEARLGYRPDRHQRVVRLMRGAGLPGYLGALTVLTLAMSVLATYVMWRLVDPAVGVPGLGTHRFGSLPPTWTLIAAVLLGLPASDLALSIVNYWSTRLMPETPLPGLALTRGVPERLRTLVVIPTMITSPEGVDELVSDLEVHYLANKDQELYFGAATDWKDADAEILDGDEALLQRAVDGINQLNGQYGDRFLLFHRPRRWNPSEGKWMGWERKRGKLEQLNHLLQGDQSNDMEVKAGRLPGPFRYVVTLDSDTRLPRESVRQLVGKMAHPLNVARLHPSGQVLRGYGILQPRVSPSLPLAEESSTYQRIFSTPQGTNPYATTVSDVYQDLFDEGSFSGKGIYDLAAVTAAWEGRIPENTLLSHDLLEGNYARSGMATDVEVVEAYPTSYFVASRRDHRWIRGDWQLLPWILFRRQGINGLGLWKMIDNLRRSLVPIAVVVGIITLLALLPPLAACVAIFALLAAYFIPPLFSLPAALSRREKGVIRSSYLGAVMEDARDGIILGLTNTVLLAHRATLCLDAIFRTMFRLLVSRKHLLEWTTAAASAAANKNTLRFFTRAMAVGLIPAFILLAVAIWRGPWSLLVAAPLVLAWLAAPLVAWLISRPHSSTDLHASPDDLRSLRLVARRTWHFFETFVGPSENHLPPDNFQEAPVPVVAHRTSPTNIGLYMLVCVAAADNGWIGAEEAVTRIEGTLETVDRLEKHKGHLLNWYDTQSLVPLPPAYVSSVDSGNFAGHLIALRQSCLDWVGGIKTPGVDRVEGVRDTLGVLRQVLEEQETVRRIGAPGIARIEEAVSTVERALEPGSDGEVNLARAADMATALVEVVGATDPDHRTGDPHDPAGAGTPTAWAQAVARAVVGLRADRLPDGERSALDGRLMDIARRCTELANAHDFKFLVDPRRGLLSIGYHVPDAQLDDSCYDLLASEARLASFFAIAKGDVKTRHWVMLGRPLCAAGGGAALASWSGSMFEYLMPGLVMRQPSTGLLAKTMRLVVRAQMSYASRFDIPWGISESAYNARDPQHTYQYSPFGVPDLGLVRGLSDNLVIAPYATGLAAMVDPGDAAANYDRLRGLGARGPFGFYEAVDFTGARLPQGEKYAVVQCYMAHHHGMTLLAIHNAVHDGLMRERFHAEPMIAACELLLQERAPRYVPVSPKKTREQGLRTGRDAMMAPTERAYIGSSAFSPAVHHLSNGRLSLTLTPAGGSQLRWNGNALTRWRVDRSTEQLGDFVYLRDDETGRYWSATGMPVRGATGEYEVRFNQDSAIYRRHRGTITSILDWRVSPESDVAVRRVTLTNEGDDARTITLASYAELVLGAAADDDAHPVFSRMFVHTEYDPGLGAIIAYRRPRASGAPNVWLGHMLVVETPLARRGTPDAASVVEAPEVGPLVPQTNRRAFLGRGGSTRAPAAMENGWPYSDGRAVGADDPEALGYTLDPIAALGQRVSVPPGGRVRVFLWTAAAATREDLVRLLDQHRQTSAYERIASLGWTEAQIQLRYLGVAADEADQFQTLAGHVLYPHPVLRPDEQLMIRSAAPQSSLWPLGISGDLPIVLVNIADGSELPLVRQMVRAFEFWRLRRFAVDLVVVNLHSTSYAEDLQQRLEHLVVSIQPRTGSPDSTGRIFLLRADQTDPEVLASLTAAARVVLDARRGDLAAQLPLAASATLPAEPATETRAVGAGTGATARPAALPAVLPAARSAASPARRPAPEIPPTPVPDPLLFFNSYGGFAADGSEYVTVLEEGRHTPAPWTNVVANPTFGFHATAEGAGYTWWRNSRDNQITPWGNDPVSAPVCEVVYVRDDESGTVLSPMAGAIGTGRHVVHHGFGYTRYRHHRAGLELDLTQYVAGDDPVKVSWLKIRNATGTARTVTITSYADLLLGFKRDDGPRHLLTEVDRATGALFVRNPWSTAFADQVVAFDMGGRQDSLTAARREVLGLHGDLTAPRAVMLGEKLAGRVGAGFDPCAALQGTFTIGAGETLSVPMTMCAATDADGARRLVQAYRAADPGETLETVRASWRHRLGKVAVRTPDRAFDLMMNGWLLYQTLACRLFARSGYYQTSGAYGFRDQLQDSMATLLVDPGPAREHLLRAASRQFVEGDVQHWWLPATGAGVRTRISDDVVWLVHATAHYLRVTGDTAVLDEQIPFLVGPVLKDDEHENFFTPERSRRTASLQDHVILALQRAFTAGAHGLPLMGGGDWNDGMNRVGERGKGESVWLGWFLHKTISDIMPTLSDRAPQLAEHAKAYQRKLLEALEGHGWDGDWYRRGYFDDGTPLGSKTRPECRIDAIAQSWAALSGAARPERALGAMLQVDEHLIMGEDQVARLFTPPFETSDPDPGYVRAYPPGVRENGGQYTHGALWSIFANAALGRQDRAGAIFALINPINHALDSAAAQTYRTEPYVIAADVYSVEPYVGRGGWTWYTGSSGWMFRAGLEGILGVRRMADRLVLDPSLPGAWPSATVTYRHGAATYEITLDAQGEAPRRVTAIEVDGVRRSGSRTVQLVDDGQTHRVVVRLEHAPELDAVLRRLEEGPAGDE
jgi:cyclic beta-1,2-glucan synthetase